MLTGPLHPHYHVTRISAAKTLNKLILQIPIPTLACHRPLGRGRLVWAPMVLGAPHTTLPQSSKKQRIVVTSMRIRHSRRASNTNNNRAIVAWLLPFGTNTTAAQECVVITWIVFLAVEVRAFIPRGLMY